MSAQRKLAVLERRKGLVREGISRCCLRDFMAFTQPLHFCSEMSKQSTLTYFSSILLVQSSLSCTFLSTIHTNTDTPITAEKLGVPYFTQGHLNEFRINFLLFYCICGFVYGLPGLATQPKKDIHKATLAQIMLITTSHQHTPSYLLRKWC